MDDKAWAVDLKVHRRILMFVNAARCPEDLMTPPSNEVLLIDELVMEPDERLHHDEVRDSHGHPGPKKRRVEPLLDRALAKRVLEARDDYNPLHGFRHIIQLRRIAGFDHLILEKLIRFFSPRYRGKWELLYAGAD